MGSRAGGEDAAQEAFISAFRGIDRFRGGSLRAWLMRIAVNAGRDMLRVRRRRPEDSLDESLTNPAFQPVAEGETPEEYATRTELNAELQRAILALPDDQRNRARPHRRARIRIRRGGGCGGCVYRHRQVQAQPRTGQGARLSHAASGTFAR